MPCTCATGVPSERCGEVNPLELEEHRQRADRIQSHGQRREHGPHPDGAGQAAEHDQLNDAPHVREGDRDRHTRFMLAVLA